jgi:hypothetical protein
MVPIFWLATKWAHQQLAICWYQTSQYGVSRIIEPQPSSLLAKLFLPWNLQGTLWPAPDLQGAPFIRHGVEPGRKSSFQRRFRSKWPATAEAKQISQQNNQVLTQSENPVSLK